MATRFYLGTYDTAPDGGLVAPTFDASWEQTTSAVRSRMRPFKRNSAFASLTIAESSTSGTFDFLFRQYISDPLNAGSITGTVKGIIRCLESATDADMRAQMLIKVVSRDGTTTTGTLLAHDASALTSEFDATTLTNRKFPLAWAGAGTALGSVSAAQGDRVVIEIGVRAHNVTATSKTATLRFGESGGADLAEDETSTVDDNPWIEFSQDLSFEVQLTDRRGPDSSISELGPNPVPVGKAVSYGAKTMLDNRALVLNTSGRRGPGSPLVTRLGSSFGIPSGKGESYSNKALSEYQRTVIVYPSARRPSGGGANAQLTPVGTTFVFKMRALASPGPGYRTWVVTNAPDFAGTQAPGAIQVGSAVVADSWEEA